MGENSNPNLLVTDSVLHQVDSNENRILQDGKNGTPEDSSKLGNPGSPIWGFAVYLVFTR